MTNDLSNDMAEKLMWKHLNDCLDDINNNRMAYHSDKLGWISFPIKDILTTEQYNLFAAAYSKVTQLVNIELTGRKYMYRTIHFKADATSSIPKHLYQTMV